MVFNDDPVINVEIEIGTVSSPTNIGSNGSTFESGTQNVEAEDLTMTILSASSATFNVKIEWLDPDGNVRREEAPTPLQGVTDVEDSLVTIKGNRFNLKVEDASSSATNNVHGTAKVQ